ncbi:helix-turn-helix domain-containing protein [Kitasatospora sp. NPDC101801]|uniref:helix-turn-helix domain-containing protein n=1 Tax=Kitasatospora sp. NPDC101801 TaxID=3364103 RepID=UPI0037FD796A
MGDEIKRLRGAAKLSQAELGALIGYGHDMVSLFEKARRPIAKEMLDKLDEALSAGGNLSRLWALLADGIHEPYLLDYVALELKATRILNLDTTLINGLLQTKEYSEEVMRRWKVRNLAEKLLTRMERQEILTGESPPATWFVVDESVLRRPVVSTAIMADQLERLLHAPSGLGSALQVIPETAGIHPGLGGSFTILSSPGEPDVVYSENALEGSFTTKPADVARYVDIYDHVRALALSEDNSRELIAGLLRDVRGR